MKKNLILLILGFTCLFLFAVLFAYQRSTSTLLRELDVCQSETKADGFYRMIYHDVFSTLNIQGVKLSRDMVLLDEFGKKKRLDEFIDRNVLVMRYSELNCDVCVDTLISCLKRRFNTERKDKLLILATYHNKSNFYIFKRINQLKEVFRIDSIGCSLENGNIPFLFFLDEDYCIKYPFIPHKEVVKETERYLDFIEKKMKN